VLASWLVMSPASVAQTPTGPRTLVLYDAPAGSPYEKLGQAYAIMLRNLLGHFDAQVDLRPVHQYQPALMETYAATFYLGAIYDNPLPPAFLADAARTQKPLVWFKYNLWKLAWDPAYNFSATRGLSFVGLRGFNAPPASGNPEPGFFDTVTYKDKAFVKFYQYDSANNVANADPDIGQVGIADPAKVVQVATISNPKNAGETVPYVARAGNFWYVADVPFSFIGPRDRYLVMADLLHDMVGIQHAESRLAMVRLEDVGALVDPGSMQQLSDYLAQQGVPFSIGVIPRYTDPLGAYNGGVPMTIRFARATDLRNSLTYARARGGEIVMHGFTHQYANVRNPHTGVSGDDFEFWNIVTNTPVAEDSITWARNRLQTGLKELTDNGFPTTVWETPHYHASPLASKAMPQVFPTSYHRAVYYTADRPNLTAATARDYAAGQFFPYVIQRDYYGQRILPEGLGNIEYDIRDIDPTSFYNYTPQDILTNADYVTAVRDGFASFFFHPFWLEPGLGVPGFDDFRTTVEGITAKGFRWVAPSGVPR